MSNEFVLTPKVSHVIDRNLGIDYGFMYHISTEKELESYWAFSAIPRWRKGFSDFSACGEYSHPATVVVNRNGGFFPLRDQEIKETRTMKLWYLPGASVSISQWPNGTHFYARVGDEDVEVSGRRKWDTKEAAEKAAKKFAQENGITLEIEP